MILCVQLLVTSGFVIMGCYYEPYEQFIRENMWLMITCLVVYFVSFYALLCVRSLARKVPVNYILLGLFTLAMSYMVSCTTIQYDPQTILIAALLTMAIVVALTIYACTTKTDLTVCGGLLFAFGAVLFVASILAFFIRSKILNIVISAFSVLLFSIYLVYDTQLILGNHSLKLEIDDYIFAALNLYLDIVMIFLEILKLLGNSR